MTIRLLLLTSLLLAIPSVAQAQGRCPGHGKMYAIEDFSRSGQDVTERFLPAGYYVVVNPDEVNVGPTVNVALCGYHTNTFLNSFGGFADGIVVIRFWLLLACCILLVLLMAAAGFLAVGFGMR